MPETAIAAPAEWQDIFDTLDAMTAAQIRAIAAHVWWLIGVFDIPLVGPRV